LAAVCARAPLGIRHDDFAIRNHDDFATRNDGRANDYSVIAFAHHYLGGRWKRGQYP
jgi:hypothetical protein